VRAHEYPDGALAVFDGSQCLAHGQSGAGDRGWGVLPRPPQPISQIRGPHTR